MSPGRNQAIGIGAMVAPLAIATVAMFTDHATFAAWQSFSVTFVLPIVLTMIGGSALIKSVVAFRKPKAGE